MKHELQSSAGTNLNWTICCRLNDLCQLSFWGRKIVLAWGVCTLASSSPHLGYCSLLSSSSFTFSRVNLSLCLHFLIISLLFNNTHSSGSVLNPLLPMAMCIFTDKHRLHDLAPARYGYALSKTLHVMVYFLYLMVNFLSRSCQILFDNAVPLLSLSLRLCTWP